MTELTEQNRLMTFSILVIAAVMGSFALVWTRSVMLPFVLSLLISYLVGPIVDWMQDNLRAPRVLGIAVAFLLIIAGVVGLGALVVLSVQGLSDNADLYQERFVGLIEWSVAIFDSLNIELGQQELERELVNAVKSAPFLDIVRGVGGGVLSTFSTGGLVIIFSGFLVAGRRSSAERHGFWGEMDQKIRRYILTKFAMSALTGILVGIILSILGLDLALVFGVLTFLLNFIPSIGSIIATLLPIPLAMLQFDNPAWVAATLLLPGAVQVGIGNILEPKILGDNLDLHPLTILIGLIFWGLIWGPVGMLLAAPIVAVLKIILERFETTRWMSELLAGRLVDFDAVPSTEP